MIDLHCHVLPGVDDGPATVEGAVALARRAEADGIATITATPHVDASYPDVGSGRIRDAVVALQARLDAAGIGIRLLTGAEVAHTRAVELEDDELRALCLGGGPWLLLECPLSPTLTPGFAAVARSLARAGRRILLAHPERSPLFLRSRELLEQLVAEGMLAQVTAGSLTGRYGRPARSLALELIARGTAHVVASDGHGEHRPATIARELREAGVDPALGRWLTVGVPDALLAGRPLPDRPAPARTTRAGALARLRRSRVR
jgi:protein-tyrosine phosphatase